MSQNNNYFHDNTTHTFTLEYSNTIVNKSVPTSYSPSHVKICQWYMNGEGQGGGVCRLEVAELSERHTLEIWNENATKLEIRSNTLWIGLIWFFRHYHRFQNIWFISINVWDIVTVVVPLCSVHKEPSYWCKFPFVAPVSTTQCRPTA